MMRAEWTAIRRRLSVRRTAHGPPWGGRKARHGSIVAPLAATVAATVAVGVRFALIEGERLGAGLRRIALGQLDIAIEMLEDSKRGLSPEQRVHEARKALKRLRALLRLVQDELGDATYEREHELVRRCGTQLAKARDAEVLLATLDGLIAREPKQLGARGGVRGVRGRVQAGASPRPPPAGARASRSSLARAAACGGCARGCSRSATGRRRSRS